MLKHIVLMKLKEDLSEQEVNVIFTGLAQLKKTLPGIMNFSYGKNIGSEGRNKGYTHVFCMDFVDEDYLQAYLEHPKHLQVKECIVAGLQDDDGLLVMDYAL